MIIHYLPKNDVLWHHFTLFCNKGEQILDDGMTFVERPLQRHNYMKSNSSVQYLDSRFILATSNICERLISKVRHTLNDRLTAMLPLNLESQIFLIVNRDLQGLEDLSKLVTP